MAGGDPFLQRQNEPSLAVSTRNPLHLLAGANDYRTVDLPGLSDKATADAWLGVFKSFDGGLTWRSTLLPGFPQDISTEGLGSPLKGFAAAADPTVRAGTNGLFYYSGIVFNRGTNALGEVFVALFIDNNNKENGDPIQYVRSVAVDTGTAGQFLDKPWLATDVPRSFAATCTISPTQSFPGGIAYLVWSKFTGSTSTKIMLSRSLDCGATWSNPTKLSESNSINQGTTVAVDPRTRYVYVAWRRFQTSSQTDAILFAKSTDFGQTFTKAIEVASITPFDQGTSSTTFHTNAFPTLAVSVDTANTTSRIHLAWPQKGLGPGGDARIVMATANDSGNSWPRPQLVDPSPARGHQIMPALTFAAGKLMLVYYDFRDDHTAGQLQCIDPNTNQPNATLSCPSTERVEVRVPARSDSSTAVFASFISDAGLSRRHTMDVRAAQADPGPAPTFSSSVRVSRYKFGSRPGSTTIEQLQVNPPNLPMFSKGTVPFIGDYIDVAAVMFEPKPGGGWQFNIGSSDKGVFHAVWTDNRDVRPPPPCCPVTTLCTNCNDPTRGLNPWAYYTPVASTGTTSVFDPTQAAPACIPGQTGSRNQNIYTARITQGLVVGSLGNSKPLGKIQRAFVVLVRNTTNQTRSFRLTIANQPSSGTASFLQFDASKNTLDVTIAPRSGISRTVFVTSTDPKPSITVNVAEITTISGGLTGSTVLNPDIVNPDIVNPDIVNPDIVNPDIVNPDIVNPDIVNPDIANPDIANASLTDASFTMSNTGNTSASFSAKLFLKGNVVACAPGCGTPGQPACATGCLKFQLLLHRRYQTPVAGVGTQACVLHVQTQNVLVANIPNPAFTNASGLANPDIANPDITNATLALPPGESAEITLRFVAPGGSSSTTTSAAKMNTAFAPVMAAVTPSLDPTAVTSGVTSVVGSQGANTGTFQTSVTLTLTTTALPDGVAGTPCSQTLGYVGGAGGNTWSITAGALPSGLTLNSATGVISGTPTTAGPFGFTVQVKDTPPTVGGLPTSKQQTSTQNLSIRIGDPLVITTTALPSVAPGAPYTAALNATGGIGNLTWSLASGSLPPGLNLSRVGVISGTAPTSAATFTFTVQVQDSSCLSFPCPAPQTATKTLIIAVDSTPPVITPTITGTLGLNGWYVSDVTVTWSVTDLESGIASSSGCGSTTITADTDSTGRTLTCSATNGAGLSSSNSITIKRDTTPPTITASISPANSASTGWYNKATGVPTISFTCLDATPGSGLAANACPAAVTLGEGANQFVSGTVTDIAGNSAGATVGPIKIDKTPPTITITSPANGATYLLNAAVASNYSCSDGLSGVSTCIGPVPSGTKFNTSTVGTNAFTVNATDVAGNTAPVTSTYTVVYNFIGFLSPLQPAGTISNPTFSGTFNLGKAVPIKWQLKDSTGAFLSSLSTTARLWSVFNGTCPSLPTNTKGSFTLFTPTSGATGGSTFRYDSTNNQFIFNWDTTITSTTASPPGPGPGSYTLLLQLNDNSAPKATTIQLR